MRVELLYKNMYRQLVLTAVFYACVVPVLVVGFSAATDFANKVVPVVEARRNQKLVKSHFEQFSDGTALSEDGRMLQPQETH